MEQLQYLLVYQSEKEYTLHVMVNMYFSIITSPYQCLAYLCDCCTHIYSMLPMGNICIYSSGLVAGQSIITGSCERVVGKVAKITSDVRFLETTLVPRK